MFLECLPTFQSAQVWQMLACLLWWGGRLLRQKALLELQHWSAFCAEAIALLGQVRERERLRVCDV